jgi:hypothetical protein
VKAITKKPQRQAPKHKKSGKAVKARKPTTASKARRKPPARNVGASRKRLTSVAHLKLLCSVEFYIKKLLRTREQEPDYVMTKSLDNVLVILERRLGALEARLKIVETWIDDDVEESNQRLDAVVEVAKEALRNFPTIDPSKFVSRG